MVFAEKDIVDNVDIDRGTDIYIQIYIYRYTAQEEGEREQLAISHH